MYHETNEYAPIDIKYMYTNLPTKSPIESNNNNRPSVVYFYNDTVNPDATDKIPPLSALVDTINSKTAVFGDIIVNKDGTPNLKLMSTKDQMPNTIVMPNSLSDDATTRFFIGSLTIIGLYMLYRMMVKSRR